MFCYQPDYFKPTVIVDPKLFASLVDNEQTRWLTARHRELRAALPDILAGNRQLLGQWQHFEPFVKYCAKEERNTTPQGDTTKGELFRAMTLEQKLQSYCAFLKKSLPFVIFVATYADTHSAKNHKLGAWRKQAACQLNGLCVIDFDHIEGDCRQVWAEACSRLDDFDRSRIFLVYVTPSGHGLKVVFAADPEVGNLIDNQIDFGAKLGLAPDQSCKDASRGAFLTPREDIIHLDETHLFTYENKDFAEKYEKAYREGKSQGTRRSEELGVRSGELGVRS